DRPAAGRRHLLRELVGPDPEGDRDLRDRPPDPPDGDHHGAQAPGPVPDAVRPEPRRPVRRAAAARRDPEVRHQAGLAAAHGDPVPLHARPGDLDHDRGRRVRDRPVRRGRRHLRREGRPLRDRRVDRDPLRLRVRRDRLLRAHARRLGERVEVLLPRRDARRRAAHLLRGRAGPRARRRDHHRAVPVADADRRGAGGHVVHRPAVRRLHHLHGRRRRGDEPPAVRPPRGGRRARAGLHDRVRRHQDGRLPLRRVPEHAHAVAARGDVLPRRLAAPVRHRPADVRGPDRGPREDVHLHLPLHVDPGHAPASALRPAHVPGLEDPSAAGDAQRARLRDPGGDARL
ncbi:MAG: NADH-ubiquinone oxidoreductase chain H, partial [uncultured Solirubrobacteraceae bacterium]